MECQPSRAARSIKPAPSTTERLNLSILATSTPAALPARTASRAASAAGRPLRDFALMPSSQYSVHDHQPLALGVGGDSWGRCKPGDSLARPARGPPPPAGVHD